MANESVATAPTVEVPAQELLDKFKATNELSEILESVIGVLEVAADRFTDDRHGCSAIYGAIRLAQDGLTKANAAQWRYSDAGNAQRALGLPVSGG